MAHNEFDDRLRNNPGSMYDYTEYLWPRPTHPILRKLNPRRLRSRRRARHAIRYEHYGPAISEGRATDVRSITLWHRDHGWPVGKVSYLICHDCRRGFIGNLDVDRSLWGQGIATRVLEHIREPIPGYLWRTSLHQPSAKSFWLLIAERTGEDYIDTDRVCAHMEPFWHRGSTRA
ncbi:GNAT family N-acetyltransferase [Nocardia sp. NPDC055321]